MAPRFVWLYAIERLPDDALVCRAIRARDCPKTYTLETPAPLWWRIYKVRVPKSEVDGPNAFLHTSVRGAWEAVAREYAAQETWCQAHPEYHTRWCTVPSRLLDWDLRHERLWEEQEAATIALQDVEVAEKPYPLLPRSAWEEV